MAKDLEEKVLVVKRKKLFGENNENYFYGFQAVEKFDFLSLIDSNAFFVWRHKTDEKQKISVEDDESLQQIIPYVVLKHKNKLFVYKRNKKITEQRLRNLFSIGVGGHINPVDGVSGKNLINEALIRELNEELIINQSINPKLVGFINLDFSSVDKVHFGLVFLIELEKEEIEVREKDVLEGKLIEVNEISQKVVDDFEGWSKIAFNFVKKLF